MYCWGDDVSDWERPEAYAFSGPRAAKAERAAVAKASAARGGRTYLKRREPDLALVDPRGKVISSRSQNPIVVAVDVTGSMATWPGEIFDRLPLLYQTLNQYRQDVELSFVAIGDATCDRFPLQVTDFARGIALEDNLGALFGEGGGGGGQRESYELFAYYLLHRVRAPEAVRPFLILYGDEGFYERIDAAQVRHYLGEAEPRGPLDSVTAWRAVAEAWNVYHLRKEYGGTAERTIAAQWTHALGPERIVPLADPLRAVDAGLGLIARSWGRYEDFERNMSARQDAAQVAALGAVLKAVP